MDITLDYIRKEIYYYESKHLTHLHISKLSWNDNELTPTISLDYKVYPKEKEEWDLSDKGLHNFKLEIGNLYNHLQNKVDEDLIKSFKDCYDYWKETMKKIMSL